jgi:hypothetical protein
MAMFIWRITIFGKTPARPIGTVMAPDEQSAVTRAIEFFQIEPAMQFRVVAVKIVDAKEPRRTKVGTKV